MTRPLGVAALAATLMLAGCSAAPEFPVIETEGTVVETAGNWSRWIEVEVTSAVDQPLTVAGARVSSPLFATTESVVVDEELAAHESLTMRLPLGTAECPPGRGDNTLQVSVVQDGLEVVQTVLLPDDALAPLNTAQCEGQVAGDAVAPSFGTVKVSEGDTLETELVLVRGESTQPVEVLAVDGTRVFDIDVADDALPLTMSSTQAKVAVPVVLSVGECEPLSPLDAAGLLTFTVDVRVGGGGEQTLTVAPQGSVESELETMLASCEG